MKKRLIGIKKFSWQDVLRLVIFGILMLISSIPTNYSTLNITPESDTSNSFCKYITAGFPIIFYRSYEGCLTKTDGSAYNFYALAFNMIFWYIVSWFLVLLGYKIKNRKKDKIKRIRD